MEQVFCVTIFNEEAGKGSPFSGAMRGLTSSVFFEGDRATIAESFAIARADYVECCGQNGLAAGFWPEDEAVFSSAIAFSEALDVLQDPKLPGIASISFDLTLTVARSPSA
jgi:hypothetical protein